MTYPQGQKPLEQTDEMLVMAFQRGDDAAFEVLFDRWRDRAVSYAWRITRRREEAEEIVTEAFCRVLEGAWRPTGKFRSFLFTVVHRLCLDTIRRRGRADRATRRLEHETGPRVTPEAVLTEQERQARLEEALEALPEEHRATLLLYYGQDLPSKEVAEVLGLEDHQVRSQLSYARRLLRKNLLPAEEEPR